MKNIALKFIITTTLTILIGIIIHLFLMMEIFNIGIEKALITTKKMIILLWEGEQSRINIKALFIFYGSIFLPLIIETFLIILLYVKKDKGDYGKARFANKKDFDKLELNTKRGICFGKLGEDKVRTDLPLSIVVVAPPGAGKSAGVIIPNLLEVPNSCIVLDIKGENEEKTSKYRRDYLGNEILIFNPFAIDIKAEPILNESGEIVEIREMVDYKEHSMFFNPFARECVEHLSYAELGQLVGQIVNTIFVSKEDDHWLKTSKELFTFFAMLQLCTKGETTFFDIAQAPQKDYFNELQGEYKESVCFENEEGEMVRDVNADTFKAYLNQLANDKTYYPPTKLHNRTTEAQFEVIRNKARRWIGTGIDEFGSIRSTFSTFMEIFCDPRVKEATSKMSFKYQELRQRRISVFVKVLQTDVEMLGGLIRVFLESIAKNLCTGEEVGKQTEKYVYLYLDEFVRFGKMEFILRLPELSRSYGVVPIYISQSYEQFELTYSKQHLGILLSTAHYQLIFRLNSIQDAESMSKTIGNYTRSKESVNAKKGLFGGRDSTSVSQEGYALMTPQDIMEINSDSLIIITSGNKSKPLQVKKYMWFNEKELKDRFLIDQEIREREIRERKAEKKQNKDEKREDLVEHSTDNIQNMKEAKFARIQDFDYIAFEKGE